MSGGTGDDGILGDDGLIFASRNGTEKGEPLYGIAPIAANDLNQFIKDDTGALTAIINVEKALKYTADLTPDNLDPGDKPNPLFRPSGANDIIFGGLGNDSIHAGAGDDAVSGAEASALSSRSAAVASMKLARVLNEAQSFYTPSLGNPTDIYTMIGRAGSKRAGL